MTPTSQNGSHVAPPISGTSHSYTSLPGADHPTALPGGFAGGGMVAGGGMPQPSLLPASAAVLPPPPENLAQNPKTPHTKSPNPLQRGSFCPLTHNPSTLIPNPKTQTPGSWSHSCRAWRWSHSVRVVGAQLGAGERVGHTHTHTHSLTDTHTLFLSHTRTHAYTHTRSLCLSHVSLSHTHTHWSRCRACRVGNGNGRVGNGRGPRRAPPVPTPQRCA